MKLIYKKTSLFLNYRIELTKNFLKIIFPEQFKADNSNPNITDNTKEAAKREEDILAMTHTITDNNLLPKNSDTDRGLVNSFTGQKATPEQLHDMSNFRKIGEEATRSYIQHQILGRSFTTNTTIRRKKLLTMSSVTQNKKTKKSAKDRESERMIKCLQRRLAWSNHTGQQFNEIEQYSVIPRALANEDGVPHKAPKSRWTDKLQDRYKQTVFSNDLLNTRVRPQCVVIDAMFVINTKPLRSTKTTSDYAKLLFSRFVKEHFSSGVTEVHLVFDKPYKDKTFNPKQFEQSRRDFSSQSHDHREFNIQTPIPSNWREVIGCRLCKQSLVKAIGLCFLNLGRFLLQEEETLVIAGCFDNTAWILRHGATTVPQPEPRYFTNATEVDQRIWRHATNSDATSVLIYSPDTDVYTIGLNISIHDKKICCPVKSTKHPAKTICTSQQFNTSFK